MVNMYIALSVELQRTAGYLLHCMAEKIILNKNVQVILKEKVIAYLLDSTLLLKPISELLDHI
jgi:hypothetical protein